MPNKVNKKSGDLGHLNRRALEYTPTQSTAWANNPPFPLLCSTSSDPYSYPDANNTIYMHTHARYRKR